MILHSVFNSTAERFPDRIAARHGQREITFRSLKEASDRVARRLNAMGVGRGVIVGLLLESGLEYIAAMIGVMKAGGIFLPLDATFPEKRLAHILAKSAPEVMITDRAGTADRIKPLMADPEACPVLVMDSDSSPEPVAGGPPASAVDPEDACYIMYTSGSTGEPKAILGAHKSLSHFMHWEIREFGFDEDVRVTQLAPVTFDASLRDIFVPLVTGGTVCIPEKSDRESIQRLIAWLEASRVSVVHCVPSLFRLITREIEEREDRGACLPALRHILMAGEALYGRDVIRWMDLVGDRIELVNFYGPSETTLIKTFYRIRQRPVDPNGVVPVGRPIANTAVLILKNGRLCEIGQMGDIYIKTPFRTKGYYRDPALTRTVFVQNPLNPDQEDILYRTGDLGRYLPDRSVAFIGRMDFQVKVNGIRIELSEIEKALMGCDFIDQGVVLARKSREAEPSLVCYYTEKRRTSPEEIRSCLGQTLPAYMLPAFYVRLDAFPLNINGKIDKKALPKPEEMLFESVAFEPPAGELEEKIAGIWAEVLELRRVGVHSPFFEIGGHSLKATRIVSRLYKTLGVEIPLKTFFEQDTIRKLATHIRALGPGKAFQEIRPVGDRPFHELSHAQRRLWILDKLEGEAATAYNIPSAYRLEGALDRGALRRAFESLIARHESLRTTLMEVEGDPRQKILDVSTALKAFQIEEIDLSREEGGERRAREHAEKEAAIPFDLTGWPLMRVKLFKISRDCHVLFLNMHHITCDAWSMDVLARDVLELYRSLGQGRKEDLPPLRIQYRDYAAWMNGRLETGELRESAAYWHEKLAGEIPILNLPTDFPRPAVQGYEGKTIRFRLDKTRTAGLTELARRQGTSLFTVCQALVKILLYRYTWQTDIVIGTPVAGRSHPDLEHQIGFYANTLALRDEIDGREGFEAVLARLGQTMIEAYDHQDYPFDRLVGELDLPRYLSRSPLFNVMLVVQEDVLPRPQPDFLRITEFPFESGGSRFDLTYVMARVEGRLEIGLNYNTDLFREETVRRFAGHLEALSASVLENPARPVRELDILSPDEREAVTVTFSATKRPYPRDSTLVDLFEEQVHRGPDRPAVLFKESALSYGELHGQASCLAALLVDRYAIGAEEPVGVMVDRNPWRVVGLMGALMSGGAYLPLDPASPGERIRHVLEDCGCRVLLTETRHMGGLQDLSGAEAVNLDRLGLGSGLPQRPPASCRPPAGRLAYVIYTSGSTGMPKGVMVEHTGFINMILDQIQTLGVTDSDRVLQLAASAFDGSLWDIFLALGSGAAVVMIPKAVIDDPHAFSDYLAETGATILALTPAYLNALDRRALGTVKTLLTAGERSNREDLLYYRTYKACFNLYGPTEASVTATVYRVPLDGDCPQAVPIGKPIANTAVLILDELLQPVPIGVAGEICIAGAGLARGYLNRPELTREKFIPHPLRNGERLYRTGDLGRWLADGNIDFLGRRDDQVKVRGYRVELGEIEKTLLRHPAVQQAVVLPPGEKARGMTAYFVPREAVEPSSIWAHLKRFLPEYMVPEALVPQERFPVTPNQKIDTKALPAPERSSTLVSRGAACQAPRTDLEARLVRLWQEVLGLERVGTEDSFFDLGGDSLKAVKVVSTLSTRIGRRVSVRTLYLHPTVAALAEAIEASPVAGPVIWQEPREPAGQARPPSLTIERRPLLSLFAVGRLKPVDSAALIYLPEELAADRSGMDRREIVQDWCQDLPVLSEIMETPLGRIASIMIPRFSAELYSAPEDLHRLILEGMEMAALLGAGTVSLTGLLPSATDYGRALNAEIRRRSRPLPAVTTGHATTTAVVILSIERILKEADRRSDQEVMGVLGLGSVGTAVLRLFMQCLPHPREILLCDVYHRQEFLDGLKEELVRQWGFKGKIRTLGSTNGVPPDFYEASLMIGATNVAEILQVERLRAGTLLVDDSGPHCFTTREAVERLEAEKDILFTEGGVLRLPSPLSSTLYLPREIEEALKERGLNTLLAHNPSAMTGCMLSGLLSCRYSGLRPTTGEVDTGLCLESYRVLRELGYQAADLHCEDYRIAEALIRRFRDHYRGGPRA